MKPSIDMKAPKVYPHVSQNAKRQQMEARAARISSARPLSWRPPLATDRLPSRTG